MITRTDYDRERLRRKRLILSLLCSVQLLLLIDFSIVNVALPEMGRDLEFTPQGLQWVASSYALAFGGLLMLGGRLADLIGHRQIFISGLTIFGFASLLGGLATNSIILIVMRTAQGIGGALIAPAVLALILMTFHEESERNRALGWFGAATASGFAVGVLAGGVLTQYFGWRAVLFVNLPLILVAVPTALKLISKTQTHSAKRQYDFVGAVTITLGLAATIYGFAKAGEQGLTQYGTVLPLVAGLILLVVFVITELWHHSPLIPLGIFRIRSLAAANVVGIFVTGIMGPSTLLLSLYFQGVQGYTPLMTGLAFLPLGLTVAAVAQLTPRVARRLGPKPVLISGIVLVAGGAALLTRLTENSSYVGVALPSMFIMAVGFGAFFTTFAISGTAGVPPSQQGLASGLLNTSTQIGTAMGVALLVSVSQDRAEALGGGASALASGFSLAFLVGAVTVAVAALLATIALPRNRAIESGGAVEGSINATTDGGSTTT